MSASPSSDPFRYVQQHIGSAWSNDPQLDLRITQAQRDRSERYLQDCYAQGKLSREEFDARIGKVLTARTRRELNAAFEGFVRVPLAEQAVGLHPVYRPLVNQDRDGEAGRWMGALAHWSGPFTWILGPAVMYALARRGSYARSEAAKAFNTQIGVAAVWVVLAIITHVLGFGWLISVWWVVAAVIAAVSGMRARDGERWRNPIQRVVPIRLVSEEMGNRPPLTG
ncbi:Uncharacterized conserved protein, Tic20 family [Propionibacterium cyclohexanicum]|uniref:Uncharacterized conserved protein, Tic20 family n=1 Tax=Propionibacterium cyclohexanicum TaxID=64702 RepID=A0A1H9R7L4_9ACTN|nr:DUF1707 and DUF4870 domain-containing protein [Propionibacterium cyclohexanicum]SER68724.1 Uncharacterized conserved protein, Tic20 family [Propionibacterium cyclohexanicum]